MLIQKNKLGEAKPAGTIMQSKENGTAERLYFTNTGGFR